MHPGGRDARICYSASQRARHTCARSVPGISCPSSSRIFTTTSHLTAGTPHSPAVQVARGPALREAPATSVRPRGSGAPPGEAWDLVGTASTP